MYAGIEGCSEKKNILKALVKFFQLVLIFASHRVDQRVYVFLVWRLLLFRRHSYLLDGNTICDANNDGIAFIAFRQVFLPSEKCPLNHKKGKFRLKAIDAHMLNRIKEVDLMEDFFVLASL